jgi:hypothetical protein
MLGKAMSEEMKEAWMYEQSDDTLLSELRRSSSDVAKRLSIALRNRQLYKLIVSPYRKKAFEAVDSDDLEHNALDTVATELGDPEKRRAFEDEISQQIGASPGDVLIYAPSLNMNMKLADMNVRWHDKDMKFREINDPVIGPRLQLILDSHEALWGIHILAVEKIAKDKRLTSLIVEAFESRYRSHTTDRDMRQREYLKKVIHFSLDTNGYDTPPMAAKELYTRVENVVEALIATAKDARSFKERLDAAIKTHVLSQ